jgi:hypothetical protein
MATLNIKDDTYERLARKAVARNTTVEDIVEPVLDRLAAIESTFPVQAPLPTAAEREKALDEWIAHVEKRANRYPSGDRA